MTTEHPGERIAKVIARAGRASRRDAERLIAEGRVTVNGETLASPARNVTPEDVIAIDGTPLAAPSKTRLFRFYKPDRTITAARDPEGRPTIYDVIPKDLPRLMPIGRLDWNSEGLLLLTNDGEVKRHLELPSTQWIRRYRVRAYGMPPDAAALARLEKGIEVEGVRYDRIDTVIDRRQGDNVWMTMSLREGKNREIRRVLSHLGLQVNRLIRVAYGAFLLGNLQPGEIEEVTGKVLREQLGAGVPTRKK
ncbi:MAG: rRNA pseudouridine synthase [Alphaproteobacteria bacterium]|nr:rRNA pseudouridine synthase [Alphaproteobacteria bacterium]